MTNPAAEIIRQAIKSQGKKYCQVAKQLGINPTKFSALLNRGVLNRELIEDIAAMLSLNQSDLLIKNAEHKKAIADEELYLLKQRLIKEQTGK